MSCHHRLRITSSRREHSTSHNQPCPIALLQQPSSLLSRRRRHFYQVNHLLWAHYRKQPSRSYFTRKARLVKLITLRSCFLLSPHTWPRLIIIFHLPVLDSPMLRLTNQRFHALIPLQSSATLDLISDELLRLERLPWFKSRGFLCCSCNRLRQWQKVADDMTVFNCIFCIECGMKTLKHAAQDFHYYSGDV